LEIVLGQAQQLVGAELQGLDGGFSRQRKYDFDASLSENVYLAGAELTGICADGEQGLYWIVGDLRDLGVDAIAIDLAWC